MSGREGAVRVRGLAKRYGDIVAVAGLDLDVEDGECVGLLGPNGAGKSTTLRVLTCLATRDEGEVRVLGVDPARAPRALKRRLGVVTQDNTLDLELTVLENLIVFARYFGVTGEAARERAVALLRSVDLLERAERRVETLSGGMQRRLQIVRALMSDPELLVLDEPTTGLDPHARHIVWERLRSLRDEGRTLLVTTHYMDEASQLCDRVVIINHGEVIADGPPGDLVERVVGAAVARVDGGWAPAPGSGLGSHRLGPGTTLVFGPSLDAVSAAVPADARRLLRPASLEDVFLVLTGTTLGD
jgi:lipooligosaccharide transport system ATP-binding protein